LGQTGDQESSDIHSPDSCQISLRTKKITAIAEVMLRSALAHGTKGDQFEGAARRIDMSPTHSRPLESVPRPVGKQDKNENGWKKPKKVFFTSSLSDD